MADFNSEAEWSKEHEFLVKILYKNGTEQVVACGDVKRSRHPLDGSVTIILVNSFPVMSYFSLDDICSIQVIPHPQYEESSGPVQEKLPVDDFPD